MSSRQRGGFGTGRRVVVNARGGGSGAATLNERFTQIKKQAVANPTVTRRVNTAARASNNRSSLVMARRTGAPAPRPYSSAPRGGRGAARGGRGRGSFRPSTGGRPIVARRGAPAGGRGGRGGRGRGGRGGRGGRSGRDKTPATKESLDADLDKYMGGTKKALDADLDQMIADRS